ncbi:MAG: M20 family metallopeptidase [Anaerolineae bacterium]|nr:M20 family metallopeptidase [Anaerolineae bacterium]
MLNLLPFLESSFPQLLSDLETLVNVDCGTYTKDGVDFCADWVNARGQEWEWDMEYYPVRDAGNCVLARVHGAGQGKFLMLGHLDTVYPEGTAAQRPLRQEGNKLLGPGVGDMKAGLLVAMYALRGLQLAGLQDFSELAIFFGCDEEIGSPVGKKYYIPLAKKADAVLVLEGARANGNIVSARKGVGQYTVRVRGHAAHAGVEPEKGANAILELAHQIIALHKLNGIAPGVTVNAGVIKGGTRTNVVPDEAQVVADVRAVDPQGAQVAHDAIMALAAQTRVPRTHIEIAGEFEFPPMAKTPAIALMADWAKSIANELGFSVQDQATGGASDANNVAQCDVPVLDGLGPVGGADHSPEEYIERDSIIPRTRLLAGLLETLCLRRAELTVLKQ